MSQLPGWLWPTSNILPPLYKKIWEAAQEDLNMRSGPAHGEVLVDTNKIFPLLLTSQLPTEVLGYIWSLANQKYAGQLTEQELYIVLALVALAQASYPFNSLEVLNHIRIPPTPNLNLALLDVASVNSDVKLHQVAGHTFLTSSSAHKKSSHLVRPKPNSTVPNLDGSPHHNDVIVKDQRLSAASSPSDISNAHLLDIRQIPHSQPDPRHQPLPLPTDTNDDFCDFQSAPAPNVSVIPNLWDFRQGSAIGSRLANHNLGVKKVNDRVKKNGSSRSSNNNQIRSTATPSSMVHTREPQAIDHTTELFPKCIIKNQTKTVILKDTAIRSEPTEIIKPVTKESLNVAEKVGNKSTSTPRSVQSNVIEPIDCASVQVHKDSQEDLMSLQPSEDKYSALRALVEEEIVTSPSHTNLEPNIASCSSTVDDFGDFISAEQIQPLSHVSPTCEDANVLGIDLLSDFDFPAESIIDSNSKSSPSLVQEISDAFNALAIGENVEKEKKERIETSLGTVEKIVQKEDNSSTNKIELSIGAPEPLIRSGSVSSLDLKSFLQPPYEDDQQIENIIQMIYWEWKQYMESCVLLLQIAAKIFTSITSELVLNEVLSSAQGYNFLVNLAEVAAVCRRVNFSHKEMDISIMGFDDLLLNIDRIWSEMEPFYTNIPIVTELPAWPAHQGDITCALCLTIITSGRVLYNDHNYHATCANLWLHAVNNNLPALRYPIPHLHSIILQNSSHI